MAELRALTSFKCLQAQVASRREAFFSSCYCARYSQWLLTNMNSKSLRLSETETRNQKIFLLAPLSRLWHLLLCLGIFTFEVSSFGEKQIWWKSWWCCLRRLSGDKPKRFFSPKKPTNFQWQIRVVFGLFPVTIQSFEWHSTFKSQSRSKCRNWLFNCFAKTFDCHSRDSSSQDSGALEQSKLLMRIRLDPF